MKVPARANVSAEQVQRKKGMIVEFVPIFRLFVPEPLINSIWGIMIELS